MCILSCIYGSHSLELEEDIELFYVVQDFCLVTVHLWNFLLALNNPLHLLHFPVSFAQFLMLPHFIYPLLFCPQKYGNIVGKWPYLSLKGEYPIDLLMEFIENDLIHSKTFFQPLWLCSIWKHKHWLTILFVCSLLPSVSGWYVVNSFNLTPVNSCKGFQNFAMKSLSLSDTISNGKLFS